MINTGSARPSRTAGGKRDRALDTEDLICLRDREVQVCEEGIDQEEHSEDEEGTGEMDTIQRVKKREAQI